MKERPILFNGEMVRSILEGRKTQTRRIIKIDSLTLEFDTCNPSWPTCADKYGDFNRVPCPYGQPGDRLWVRETYQSSVYPTGPLSSDEKTVCVYRADVPYEMSCDKWRPSIHMPRGASRITLEIVDVQVERLQDISEEGAFNEGCEGVRTAIDGSEGMGLSCKEHFSDLWESINGPDSWNLNPWVWVITFKTI